MDPVFHFVEYLSQQVPGIKLVKKSKSRMMRILNFFCFFNENFMTSTITVIGKTIYIPDRIPHDLKLISIVAHEYVHIKDFKRYGILGFFLRYSFPQIFALFSIFALGALWSIACLIALFSLIFLIPQDAPWRVTLEKRAYGMSLLFNLWTQGTVTPTQIQSTIDVLHGSTYYWPGGSPALSRMYFDILIESAKHGVLPPEPEYADVWRYLNQEKYLVKPTT